MAKAAALYKLVPAEIPANAPYLPPVVSQEEAWAIKALISGTAAEGEQGIVWRFLLGVLCAVSSFPHYPTDRDTTFMNGRRYVGHHLLRIGQMTPEQITQLQKFAPGAPGGEDDEMPTF